MKLFLWGCYGVDKKFSLKAFRFNHLFDDDLKNFFLESEYTTLETKLIPPKDGRYTILRFKGGIEDGEYKATLISPLEYGVERITK